MAEAKPKIRCAIYTRKSSEEGLEQEYNSLDAQRDAGEAYIKSQQHEGWQLIKKHYDDGGFSGGNINRPALQELMKDIESGLIDIVVVYKVDRLSRSLHDFAKLVEVFDKNNVSFVSVTQAFNTTNSMGRLTLNILLSFAQFEREVTSERIRDKFASSKKKGLWMGGRLVLGYHVHERKLIINEEEASQVRFAYEQYLKLDSIYDLLALLKQKDIRCKSWKMKDGTEKQGGHYKINSLYSLLKNPIYKGKVTYKGEEYEGEHAAIIDDGIWYQVQEKLKSRSVQRMGGKYKLKEYVLRGKLFDDKGNSFYPTYSSKVRKETRCFIRYYIIKDTIKAGYSKIKLRSVNADEVERIVDFLLKEVFKTEAHFYQNWLSIKNQDKEEIIKSCLKRVEISSLKIQAEFDIQEIEKVKERYKNQTIEFIPQIGETPIRQSKIELEYKDDTVICSMNYLYKNYGGRKIITDKNGIEVSASSTYKNPSLIRAIVNATAYRDLLKQGKASSVTELARYVGKDKSYVSKIIKLYYLPPHIKESILDGTQPRTMSIQSLMDIYQDTI